MSLLSRFINCCTGRYKKDGTPTEDTKIDDEWEKVEYENEIDTTVENDDCLSLFNKTKKVLVTYEKEIKDFFISLLKFHIEKFYVKTSKRKGKKGNKKYANFHIIPKLDYQLLNKSLDYDSEKEKFRDYKEKKQFITNHFNNLEKMYYHS